MINIISSLNRSFRAGFLFLTGLLVACALHPANELKCRSVSQIRETIRTRSRQLEPYYPEIKKYAEKQGLDIHHLTTLQLSFTVFPDGWVDYVTIKFPFLQERPQMMDLYILTTLQRDLNQFRFPPVEPSCGSFRVVELEIDLADWLGP